MNPADDRRLVVVADDFGLTSSVNRAIIAGHDNGIVTAASIMAGGEAFDDAVRLARNRETLSVGLHVTLCDGNPVLPALEIPDLVAENGGLTRSPEAAWLRFTRPGLLPQIEREIRAQFDRLDAAGIRATHVDGHHHVHMHPSVFPLLCGIAAERGIRWIRIPCEPLWCAWHRPAGRLRGLVEWSVFGISGFVHRKTARRSGLRSAGTVFGLAGTQRFDVAYLLRIIAAARGLVEIFCHPDEAGRAGCRELRALTSVAVRDGLAGRGIRLTGYREL